MTALLVGHFTATTLTIATERIQTSWEWYIIRAAGFVSAGLVILLMLSGIGQITGMTYRFIEPVKAWMLHKAMALALCVSLFIHVLFILLDKFVPFTIPQVLLPFLSHNNNGTTFLGFALGGLAVSFGILAMYGIVIIVLTSLGWIDSHKTTWRWLHYLGYVVMPLVLLHGLYEGTDLKHGFQRILWLVLFFIIVLGIASRLRRVGSLRSSDSPD